LRFCILLSPSPARVLAMGRPFRGEGSRSRHGLHRVQVGYFDFLRLDDRKASALADWAFAVIGFASAAFANDDAVVAHCAAPY
jgi:hypothetical protein